MTEPAGNDATPRTHYTAGAVAVVAGAYAVALAWTSPMGAAAWAMGLLGVIVLAHGILLFTAYGMRPPLGTWSGGLMVTYGFLMFAQQAWVTTMPGAMSALWPIAGADGVMIALALAMLATGAFMLRSTRARAAPRAA